MAGLWDLLRTIGALNVKLDDQQRGWVLDAIRPQMAQTTDSESLANVLTAIGEGLDAPQAEHVCKTLLETDDSRPDVRQPDIARCLALPVEPSAAELQPILDPILRFPPLADDKAAHARELEVLAPKLAGQQPRQALDAVLRELEFSGTTDPYPMRALVRSVRALAPKLTTEEAQLAAKTLLEEIAPTNDTRPLRAFAEAFEALAPKLPADRAMEASKIAITSFAWASTPNEAMSWASALVALLPQASASEAIYAEAAAYPTAAGPASDLLVNEWQHRYPATLPADVPTEATTLTPTNKRKPVFPPACPKPLQPNVGLRCPSSGN